MGESMSYILVVTGSARPNSVNEKMVPEVVSVLEKKGAEVKVADLKQINLPFFDAPYAPTSPDYTPSNEVAKEWTQMVADANGVVFVTPEYNHTLSAIQLNAIDWIGKEWEHKPIALVGYGWSGAIQAHAAAREALSVNLKANVGDAQANLHFMKDINPDGTAIDADVVQQKITASVEELLQTIAK